LRYPIRNEIPVLLEEEAEKLDEESWRTAIAAASSTLGPPVEPASDEDA